MGVAGNFKRTEAGVIPFDWEVRFLRDIGNIRTGPFGTLLKADEYSASDGVPMISVGEVGEGEFRVHEGTPLIPPTVVRRLPQYVLNEGDIVLGRKGAVDRSAVVQSSQSGWFLGSDGIRVRVSRDCHPQFVGWQLQRGEIRAWLLQNSTGTTMPSMNQEILGRVAIALPPLAEQRAIAAALGDVDALLASLDKLIAKKRDLKQAAMQQLLTGRTRLPGFSGKWQLRTLGELGSWKGGLTPSMANPAFWTNGDIPWASSGDVKGPILSETTSRITRTAVRSTALTVFGVGTVLLVTRSGILRRYLPVARTAVPMTVNQDIKALRVAPYYDADFVLHSLRFHGPEILGDCLKAGTTVESIEFPWLKQFQISIPALEEQNAIAAVLSDMDAELDALERRREKTALIKQGMMQELLTGRTRLV